MAHADTRQALHNAIVMVYLDGRIHDDEKRFIRDLRDRLGISDEDFAAVLRDVKANPKQLTIPRGEQGRELLEALCQAALADGEVCQAERGVLEKVTAYLQLDMDVLESLLPTEEVSMETALSIAQSVDALYKNYGQWDTSQRQASLDAIAQHGRDAVLPLLQIIESYRSPAGMNNAIDMKTDVVRRLGEFGDDRAVYYLIQQVNIGDGEDEISNPALRTAAAQAIEAITGEAFGADPVDTAREWWKNKGRRRYNTLAL